MGKGLGIYIHIPFCVQKCRYCDFCSFADRISLIGDYANELCGRIRQTKALGYSVDTVYLGGGTPSLLPERELSKVLEAVSDTFELSRDAEITLECNPATADKAYFTAARSFGVNRLSIGLQSALDSELALLGRIHTATDFVHTYNAAREAGFDNISADLMYGIPDQTLDSLERSAAFLCDLSPEHISAYGLTVEDGTYFASHRSELNMADADGQYEMYMLLSGYLTARGYQKYEISNFAKTGRESRHNMRYWRCGEYLGFGVAAHSYFEGERFGNSRDICAFLAGEDIVEERVRIDEKDALVEYIMLGLRLGEGISLAEYQRRVGVSLLDAHPAVNRYINEGFMTLDGDRLAFTDRGFFVSNSIISEIIEDI